MQHLIDVRIDAGDMNKHDICFSRIAGGWMLENERDGLVSVHKTFSEAVNAMAQATAISSVQWTVNDNPYHGD